MRVRTGRLTKIPGRSQAYDPKQFFEKLTATAFDHQEHDFL
jgi:hypothetical protein